MDRFSEINYTSKIADVNRSKPILSAVAGNACPSPPIWLMRQAGRHLPEYRKIRQRAGGFLDLVCAPDLACEVTLQPVRRYGLDGSILFSDILVIPWALGQDLWFETGEGPKLGPKPKEFYFDLEKLNPIFETLKQLNLALRGSSVTQLGFAGAPWTVATYMIEGGKPKFAKSREFLKTPGAKHLFRVLIDATISYCSIRISNIRCKFGNC